MEINPQTDPVLELFGESWDVIPASNLLGPGDSVGRLRASVIQPIQWDENVLLGDKWQMLRGGYRHYLVRLAFTIRAEGDARARTANFNLSLHPRGKLVGKVHDTYPKELYDEVKTSPKIGIGSDFIFLTSEVSMAKAETTIEVDPLEPIIRSNALQESTFSWTFERTGNHSLEGTRMMYVVVALPAGMRTTLVTFQLAVEFECSWTSYLFGGGRRSLPETALQWEIGEREEVLPAITAQTSRHRINPKPPADDIAWDFLYHGTYGRYLSQGPQYERVPTLPYHFQSPQYDYSNPSSYDHGALHIEAGVPVDIFILAERGNLTSANTIYSTGGSDTFVPMQLVKDITVDYYRETAHKYDLWKGTIPGQPAGTHVYYRIQVNNQLRSAYLKAGNSVGGAYINPFGQWVCDPDAPAHDNYHYRVLESYWRNR